MVVSLFIGRLVQLLWGGFQESADGSVGGRGMSGPRSLLAGLPVLGYDELMQLFLSGLEFFNVLHLAVVYVFFVIRQYGYILGRRSHVDEALLLVLGLSGFRGPHRFDGARCLDLLELIVALGLLFGLGLRRLG